MWRKKGKKESKRKSRKMGRKNKKENEKVIKKNRESVVEKSVLIKYIWFKKYIKRVFNSHKISVLNKHKS